MFLSAPHVPGHLIHQELAARHFLVFSSRMARADFRAFFSGTGFTDRAIVWGQDGFAAYRQAHPGRCLSLDLVDGGFSIGEFFGSKYVLRTDPIGQDVLYLWRKGADWAISNSLYVLAREIEALGHHPQIYAPALAVFSLGAHERDHGQLISRNTALEGAILVPSNCALWISFTQAGPQVEMVQSWDFALGPRNPGVYLHRLVDFVSAWRNRLLTLSRHGIRQNLSLSAGKDSRAVLALMLSLPEARIHARTWAGQSDDFPIASAMIAEYGLASDLPPDRALSTALSASEHFALHMMSGAGVRRFNYADAGHAPPPGVFFMGGAGFDSVVLRSPLARRIENAQRTKLIDDPTLRAHAIEEYRLGGQDIPGGVTSENAILFHYGAYRGRFHYGRKTLAPPVCQMMPLFSRASSEVVLSAVELRYVRMSGFNYDLVSLCAPQLLKYPFTGPQEPPLLASRDLSLSDLPAPQALKIYGSPTAPEMPARDRVEGPDGLSLLCAGLEPAIKKFGHYFAEHVIERARAEVVSGRGLAACRNAALICGLEYIFPDP